MRINQKFHTIVQLVCLLSLSFLHLTCSDCDLENTDELEREVEEDIKSIVGRYDNCQTNSDCIRVSTSIQKIDIDCGCDCNRVWILNQEFVDEFTNEIRQLNEEKCVPHKECYSNSCICPEINYLPGSPACLEESNKCGTRDDGNEYDNQKNVNRI